MTIGQLTLELHLPMARSLKDKRGMLKPLIVRLRRDYNVSVIEAEAQDVWTRAVVVCVCVSHGDALVQSHLQQIANRAERWRMDVQLEDYYIEIVA